MPSSAIFDTQSALEYLKSAIPVSECGRDDIIELASWVASWDREEVKHVMCYLRDTGKQNVGYFIDVKGNRDLDSKPYFLIVKLKDTDRERAFKALHVEFRLDKCYSNPHGALLQQRDSNQGNWIVLASDAGSVGLGTLKELTKQAYSVRN